MRGNLSNLITMSPILDNAAPGGLDAALHLINEGAHHHAFTPVNACTDGGHLKTMTAFCRLDRAYRIWNWHCPTSSACTQGIPCAESSLLLPCCVTSAPEG